MLVAFTTLDPTVAGQMSAGPADGALSGVMRYGAGPYTSNTAIVQVSAAGKIQIQATTTTNVLVDVQGYYTSGNGVTAAGGYSPVTMTRIVDTVNGVGLPKATLGAGTTSTIQVTGKASVPAGAAAVFVNFQVNNATSAAGYINPFATSATTRPSVSLNFDGNAHPYTSIGAIVPLDSSGAFKLYVSPSNTINLLVDVEGYFTAGSSNGTFTPAVGKIYDTRSSTHVAPGATVTIPIGGTNGIPSVTDGLSAITANLTVIDQGTSGGYARAWPTGVVEPTNVGTLTFNAQAAGSATTNLATIAVGADNGIQIHNVSADTVDYIVDLEGWYVHNATLSVSCKAPYQNGAWVSARANGDINCIVTSNRAPSDNETIQLDDNGVLAAPTSQSTQGTTTTIAFAFTPSPGQNQLTARYLDEGGLVEGVAQYAFGSGDWSTDTMIPGPEDGSTSGLTPDLQVVPSVDAFDTGVQITYTVKDTATQGIVYSATAGADGVGRIPAGTLAYGSNYTWTATISGGAGGRTTVSTVVTPPYALNTITLADSSDTSGVLFTSQTGDDLAAVVDNAVATSGVSVVADELTSLASSAAAGADINFNPFEASNAPTAADLQAQANRISADSYTAPSPAPVSDPTPTFHSMSSWSDHMTGTPQRGYFINHGRSWVMEPMVETEECVRARCRIVDKYTSVMTFDPNLLYSKMSAKVVHTIQTKNLIGGMKLEVRVYRNQYEDGHLSPVRLTGVKGGVTFTIPLDTSLAFNSVTEYLYVAQWNNNSAHSKARSATTGCSKDWCTWK